MTYQQFSHYLSLFFFVISVAGLILCLPLGIMALEFHITWLANICGYAVLWSPACAMAGALVGIDSL